jgi:uncharacterized Zn-finger protein
MISTIFDKCFQMNLHNEGRKRKYPKRSFDCPICLKSFSHSGILSRHKEKIHRNLEGNKFFCNDCKKTFSGVVPLKNHIAIYHSNAEPDLPCPMSGCSRLFITSQQLQNHVKTHEGKREICPECGLFYSDKRALDKHIKRIHLKIKDFCCDLCEYRGTFKNNIADHVSFIFTFKNEKRL